MYTNLAKPDRNSPPEGLLLVNVIRNIKLELEIATMPMWQY